MNSLNARLERQSLIDRSKPIRFQFNGEQYTGYQGDTLASALIANDVLLVARSFRYHRPRGIFSSGPEECHAIVSVGRGAQCEANVRATQQPLFEGLEAFSQNAWPTLKWDLGAVSGWFSRFMPVGFYYKTFMWPSWKWYERLVRHLAGVGPAPAGRDSSVYDKQHAHCDLLIIGAGPAGLAAAIAAAPSGLRIILADEQTQPGGALLWNQGQLATEDGLNWSKRVSSELVNKDNVTLLSNTTIVAAWDHAYFTAEQRLADAQVGHTNRRLWKIRAKRVILASGSIERPLVFPSNDRPGIMLAASVRQYINRYAVKAGSEAVIFTNNDSAYLTAFELQQAGILVNAIVDVRDQPNSDLCLRAKELGIKLFTNHEVCNTRGYFRISQVKIRTLSDLHQDKRDGFWLECDLLAVSGGWSPSLHLQSQAGGKLIYSEQRACFIPGPVTGSITAFHVAGSANGQFDLADCLAEGHAAGLQALEQLGIKPDPVTEPPISYERNSGNDIKPHWSTHKPDKGRQWVDHLHDVSVGSIETAIREGFVSVEHLKRYTTTGMAIDQGKTANVNALGILSEVTGKPMSTVGTTTFRPPYTPVTLGSLAGRETGVRAWPIRRSPLHSWHAEAGAVLEDHSGWLRPAYYPQRGESEGQAIKREVIAARQSVALFDSSSLGKIEVSGPDAARFLNRMYINNVETLKTGRIRYGMMLNENGIILDDGVFARLGEQFFLISSSSAGSAEVTLAFEEWLQTEWPDLDVLICNVTSQWATLTISGPQSREVLQKLLPDEDLAAASLPHMALRADTSGGIPYRLMRVSFTGELSFELNVPANRANSVWTELLAYGKPHNITPLGMEALDVLRTEKGYLEVGVDTDVSTNPLDVGWSAPISKKQADFIGKRSLSRKNDMRQDRMQLVGLKPKNSQQFIPVGSHIICPHDSNVEGHVTSSCLSPTLGYSIALAMLVSGSSRLGETIHIDVNGQQYEAAVVPLSFYDPKGERINK